MQNYVQPGDVVTITAAAAITSGQLVNAGLLVGVAGGAAAIGEQVEIKTRGVFELPKTSAQAWTVGAAIYMIPASGLCTTATTAGNILIGVALAAAANPSATGTVRLNGAAPAAATA